MPFIIIPLCEKPFSWAFHVFIIWFSFATPAYRRQVDYHHLSVWIQQWLLESTLMVTCLVSCWTWCFRCLWKTKNSIVVIFNLRTRETKTNIYSRTSIFLNNSCTKCTSFCEDGSVVDGPAEYIRFRVRQTLSGYLLNKPSAFCFSTRYLSVSDCLSHVKKWH